MYFNKDIDMSLFVHSFRLFVCEATYGDVAQMARAPALQAGGQEFDSPYLHQKHIEKYIKEGKTSIRNVEVDQWST